MGRLNCKNAKICGHNMCFELACRNYEPHETAKQTRADRIRAMSDEELADWLARTQIANTAEALEIAKIPYEQSPGLKEYVTKECLEWLKQPAEGE